MAKGTLSNLKSYAKNVFLHARRLVRFRESPGQALSGIWHDTGKLRRVLRARNKTEDHREAKRLVDAGREHYNQKRYKEAEAVLRDAIILDRECAAAYAFLGYALYKQGRYPEAVTYWEEAVLKDPGSEVASKARKKIDVVRAKKRQLNEWIDSRR